MGLEQTDYMNILVTNCSEDDISKTFKNKRNNYRNAERLEQNRNMNVDEHLYLGLFITSLSYILLTYYLGVL